MKTPRFSTLLSQAQQHLPKQIAEINEQIAKLNQEITLLQEPELKAAEFFASGMSFCIKAEHINDEYVREIIRDCTGQMYRSYLEADIKDSPYKQELLAAFDRNPSFAFAQFMKGYDYEENILNPKDNDIEEELQSATPQATSTGSLEIIKDDITTLNVDVIVNAANGLLLAGGGVCGSIHHAAGPKLEEECLQVPGRPIPTGNVVMTDAYHLPCKKVIHAVGPIWQGGSNNEEQLLGKCYKDSITLAYNSGYQSIAFPFISSGIFGYPKAQCARVALESILQVLSNVPIKVTLCAFSNEDLELFLETRNDLGF